MMNGRHKPAPYAPWVQEIPTDWCIGSIGRMAYLKARVGWQNLRSDEFVDEGPFCVTGTDFADGRINWSTCYHVSEARYETDPHIQLRNGDLLVTKDGTIGKLALVQNMPNLATLNSGVFVIRPLNGSFDSRYLYWVLCSALFDNFVWYIADGTTINHLYQNLFVRFHFPVPPLSTQLAIVAFLDCEIARIDALIDKKRRLLEFLEGKRLAVITHAVTKGLNPDVPMKDSGIRWLGHIPAHWELKRQKFISPKVTVGIVVTPAAYYVEAGIPALRGFNVKERHLDLDDLAFISEDANELHAKSKIFEDDLIAVRTGQPGTTAIVPKGLDGANCVDLIIIRRSKEIVPEFAE
jgi:type I restriction enzyme S subunit